MDSVCQDIQIELTERCGDASGLNAREQDHLAGCSECRSMAHAELSLHAVFAEVSPNVDLEGPVMQAIAGYRPKRRLFAAIPVAASAMITALGVLLIGGVPGGSLLGLLPLQASQGWMVLAEIIGNWGVVLSTSSGAVSTSLSSNGLLGTEFIAVLGMASTVLLARRWRSCVAWLRGD
ncbi:MAG: hypothetical protein GY906_19840 [bacterium]|nr:hypothetical protein [bacterium]